MNDKKNPFAGEYIEFHILQDFPVSCLNRDDVGAPKSAIVGGVERARVSSQCWKRQVRMCMHAMGYTHANRTKRMYAFLVVKLIEAGACEKAAQECAKSATLVFSKLKVDGEGKEPQSDVLVFFSNKEADEIVNFYKERNFVTYIKEESKDKADKKGKGKTEEERAEAKKSAEESTALINRLKANTASVSDGLDIALFGRMVAKHPELEVEAACSFSHAISTHRVDSEIDFFTALDDLKTDPGSAYMGNLEFNSATYYRYVSLNLGQLYQTLRGVGLDDAIEAFVKALYLAVPEARQHTQSASNWWDYALIYVRKGQRLQASFETPVRATKEGGYLQASEKHLKEYLDAKAHQAGSLFGLVEKLEFGDGSNLSIDDVIASLKAIVDKDV